MMSLRYGVIYKLVDPLTGDLRYIGYTKATLQRRLTAHLIDSRNKNKTHKHHWIRSLLTQGLLPQIGVLKTFTESDSCNWEYWEKYFIKKHTLLGHKLTNGTAGGECTTLSIEACGKISKALTGRTGKLCANSKSLVAYNDHEEFFFYSSKEAERYFRDKGLPIGYRNINQCIRGTKVSIGRKPFIRTQVSGYKFKRITYEEFIDNRWR